MRPGARRRARPSYCAPTTGRQSCGGYLGRQGSTGRRQRLALPARQGRNRALHQAGDRDQGVTRASSSCSLQGCQASTLRPQARQHRQRQEGRLTPASTNTLPVPTWCAGACHSPEGPGGSCRTSTGFGQFRAPASAASAPRVEPAKAHDADNCQGSKAEAHIHHCGRRQQGRAGAWRLRGTGDSGDGAPHARREQEG